MILQPSPVSTAQFSYDVETHAFISELSELGPDFRFGRVYDDACDEGLTLISTRTGSSMVFFVRHSECGEDGLLWIDLLPAKTADRQTGISMRIYND